MSGGVDIMRGFTGRHVLLVFVAFFGLVFLANGIFLYYAISTFGGGDTSDPYRKGLHYNDTLAEAARQDSLGWREQVAYLADSGRLTLKLNDREGLPVSGLHIGALIGRPATDRDDFTAKFKEVAGGIYEAEVALGPGQWILQLQSDELARDGEPVYRLKQRLYNDAKS